MNAHDTPSGTRMMCVASVNAICARAHGTGIDREHEQRLGRRHRARSYESSTVGDALISGNGVVTAIRVGEHLFDPMQ